MGREVIRNAVDKGVESDQYFLGSSMNNFLVKFNSIDEARRVFDAMAERELICWNLMIDGYVQAHYFNEAFGLFFDMHCLGIRPSQVTMVSIIQAYMETRNLKLGKFVHGCVFGLGMGYYVLVLTSLVDMNGKMGDVESAQSVFVSMPIRNLISWKVMISGFVQNELAQEVVDLFQRLVLSGGGFDSGTGVSLLQSCAPTADLGSGKIIYGCIYRKGRNSICLLQFSICILNVAP